MPEPDTEKVRGVDDVLPPGELEGEGVAGQGGGSGEEAPMAAMTLAAARGASKTHEYPRYRGIGGNRESGCHRAVPHPSGCPSGRGSVFL